MFGIKEVKVFEFDTDVIKPGHAYKFSFKNYNPDYADIIGFIGFVIKVDENTITYIVMNNDEIENCISVIASRVTSSAFNDVGNVSIYETSTYELRDSYGSNYHKYFKIKELQSTISE